MDNLEDKDVDFPKEMKIEYLKMSDGAELRHAYYYPNNSNGHILLYPGMNTLVLSWIKILELLILENYSIDYVESREKFSSKINHDYQSVNKFRMLLDCNEIIDLLNLSSKEYIAIGSSLGSTTLIQNMANGSIRPPIAILVGPSVRFKVASGLRILLPFLTKWTYDKFVKVLMKRIAVKKYTNEKVDPLQKRKYELALELADPLKLKNCVKSWLGNNIYNDLEKIDGKLSKCYLIGASEDILHPDHETRDVSNKIENAIFVDLKTNSAAHDLPLIEFIKSL